MPHRAASTDAEPGGRPVGVPWTALSCTVTVPLLHRSGVQTTSRRISADVANRLGIPLHASLLQPLTTSSFVGGQTISVRAGCADDGTSAIASALSRGRAFFSGPTTIGPGSATIV